MREYCVRLRPILEEFRFGHPDIEGWHICTCWHWFKDKNDDKGDRPQTAGEAAGGQQGISPRQHYSKSGLGEIGIWSRDTGSSQEVYLRLA